MISILRLIKQKFARLGPGFITGAADNDPSGITTYTIAGARFGYKLNWLTLFLIPMMISIQEMCGRIGLISGRGLAGVIKKYYSHKLLILSVTLLFIANTINIGANLGAMAASLQMILGLPFIFWLILITVLTVTLEVFVPYDKYSRYLKFMAFSLVAYGITALLVKQNWLSVIRFTLIPHIEFNLGFLMTLVGFLGTTISPYLFFWQASEEIEEQIKEGKISEFEETPQIVEEEIRHMRKDTAFGMSFANMTFFFILLTTTGTLHANGITEISNLQQAATALQPLAGNLSYLLFTFGMIGIGLQSVPILAGSAAYAVSEAFGFKEGLAKKFAEAKTFYLIIGLATLLGALMNLIGINIVNLLFYTAIINGIIAVPLIMIIIKLADDERIVGKYKTEKINRIFAWIGFLFMGITSCLMILALIRSIHF